MFQRSYPAGGHYGFSQWSSQPVSNETSTGFFLERTPSVRGTIQNASALMREVCGEEDRVDVDGDEEITSTPPSKGNGHAPLTRTGSGAVLPVYRANLDESLQGIPEDPKTSPLVKLATTPVDSANSTQSDESPTEVKSPMSAELGSAIRLSKSADSGLATTSDISQTSMRPIGSVSFTSRLSESDGTLGGTPALYSTVENLADISREKEKADELVKENANKD